MEDEPHVGHGSLNDTGGEFGLEEHFAVFGKSTVNSDIFGSIGSGPGKTRSKSTFKSTGKWVIDGANIEETFKGGPICLSLLARTGVSTYQHNFLIDCSTFLKKKYPDNWEEPLRWINMHVLRPSGDSDKLMQIIKTVRDKQYYPRCNDEPMCSHCHARACRFEPFGVGDGSAGLGEELVLTKINTVPMVYFVGEGETRMRLHGDDLAKLERYRVKCLEHGRSFPTRITQKDWLEIVKTATETAAVVEPSDLYRKDVRELEAIEKYFGAHIPNMVRAKGDQYLKGLIGDYVRIRIKEERIYFKWDKLKLWCERALNHRAREIESMRAFVDAKARAYDRTSMRGWFRCSLSMDFVQFDEFVVHQWLHPDEEQEEDDGETNGG